MIKIFKCGLCKQEEQFKGTRAGLRKHLREKHKIVHMITNKTKEKSPNATKTKQSWWIDEEFE